MFKYLRNYRECIIGKHDNYQFRTGENFSFVERSSAEHIFSEIFIGDCYPLNNSRDEKKVIVDIGANIGFFTLYGHINYPKARIIAVEANPINFNIFKNNICNNGLGDNVKLYNKIISSSTRDEQPFYLSSNSGWSSIFNKRGALNGEIIFLKSLSLSKLFLENNLNIIDILKIDVEGAEYDIMLNDNFFDNYSIKKLFIEVDKNPRDKRYTFSELKRCLSERYKKVDIYNINTDYPLIHCDEQKEK